MKASGTLVIGYNFGNDEDCLIVEFPYKGCVYVINILDNQNALDVFKALTNGKTETIEEDILNGVYVFGGESKPLRIKKEKK